MAPLLLEGKTLGQRHYHYNKLVKAAKDDQTVLLPLNYDDPDVDNLLRIDVACSQKNVEYVLDVLQSDDMLYVSRVIKKSIWLVTDEHYAYIINPEYLQNELFPKMLSKAKNKLMLAIRLNLRSESRVEEFYRFYSNNIKISQKWLPRCSLATIKKAYEDHARDITSDTFKRILCKTSFEDIKILLNTKSWYYIGDELAATKFFLSKYANEYLEVLKTLEPHDMPTFGIRATQKLMYHCSDEVTNNFQRYANNIHLPTFAKCLKKEDIPIFLLKQADNREMGHWIQYENIKHFVIYLPIATRFEFVKKLFIDKRTPYSNYTTPRSNRCACIDGVEEYVELCDDISFGSVIGPSTNASIYRWYRFAPFDKAFVDLKKLIRMESSPAERNSILTVLINNGRRNPTHIKTLLQFYRDCHNNEPFKFKVQFINSLITLVETYKFDVETWSILNDIFLSMEVYMKSEKSVAYCVKAIIVYKLLHNEEIPEIIADKHTFDTFKEYRKQLEDKDRKKLFTYLYNLEIKKLKKLTISNETQMNKASNLLDDVLNLLKDWEKKITEYPEVLEAIRQLVQVKKEHSLNNDLSYIYKAHKKWKKDLFEVSLLLQPDDEVCVRALKYDPGLLQRHSVEVYAMRCNDEISLKRTLRRLRIYWALSLAKKWAAEYRDNLQKPTGHKATIEGLCILLPRKQFQSLLEKYTPVEYKIDWNNTDKTKLNLQKNIAKQMKLIRPSLNLEAVLLYAKVGYLKFVLPSFHSLLSNMSDIQVSKCVPVLFNAPVSIKKHGLRLAYAKVKFSEIKNLVEHMWKNTNYSSIKKVLFRETFKLLTTTKNDLAITELWQLLSMFIDTLTPDENIAIYDTLIRVENVPMSVRHDYFVKTYSFLTTLPAKANCKYIIQHLNVKSPDIMDRLEPSFVETYLLKPVLEFVSSMTGQTDESRKEINENIPILTSYLIHSENEEAQFAKYEKYVKPVLERCFEAWQTIKNGEFIARNNLFIFLGELLGKIKLSTVNKSVIYTKIFKDIETKLRILPIEENYSFVTYWSLAVLFVESLDNYLKDNSKSSIQSDGVLAEDQEQQNGTMTLFSRGSDKIYEENCEKWDKLCVAVAPLFGKSLLNFVKSDVYSQNPSLATYFASSLRSVFIDVELNNMARLLSLRQMLDTDLTVIPMIVFEVEHRHYKKDEKLSNLTREIHDIIKTNPSVEVKVQYYEAVSNDPSHFENIAPY